MTEETVRDKEQELQEQEQQFNDYLRGKEQELKDQEEQLTKWGKTLEEAEQELMNFSKEIIEREKAAAQWERELAAREADRQKTPEGEPADEAKRYDLFFGATNDKHEAARPIASVILEPQPVRQEVSRADLMAMGAMILSLGALAASVAAVLL